jgi:hypothetical protein
VRPVLIVLAGDLEAGAPELGGDPAATDALLDATLALAPADVPAFLADR